MPARLPACSSETAIRGLAAHFGVGTCPPASWEQDNEAGKDSRRFGGCIRPEWLRAIHGRARGNHRGECLSQRQTRIEPGPCRKRNPLTESLYKEPRPPASGRGFQHPRQRGKAVDDEDDFRGPIGRLETATPLVQQTGVFLVMDVRYPGLQPPHPPSREAVLVPPDRISELSEALRNAAVEWRRTYSRH